MYWYVVAQVNDATDMSALLAAHGYTVTTLLDGNANKGSIERELELRFIPSLKPRSQVIVYFAGHGAEIKGKNYLIPADEDVVLPGSVPREEAEHSEHTTDCWHSPCDCDVMAV